MGYDIQATGSVRIEADKIDAAVRALLPALTSLVKDGVSLDRKISLRVRKKEYSAKDLVYILDSIYSFPFVSREETRGSVVIDAGDDEFRELIASERMFDALAPFINGGGVFYFEGDDGNKWRWRFDGRECHDESGEAVYGVEIEAPAAINKIVDVLFPDNKLPEDLDPATTLEALRKIITDAGFGPFAGMSPIDALAAVVEVADE